MLPVAKLKIEATRIEMEAELECQTYSLDSGRDRDSGMVIHPHTGSLD